MKKTKKKAKKQKRVIGLAFISPDSIKLVLERKEWVSELCPSENFKKWTKLNHDGRKKVALLTDKASFQEVLNSNVDAIVTFCPWSWIHNRGIECLDAYEREDAIITHKNITPDMFHNALKSFPFYKKKTNDIWLSKGKPSKKIDVTNIPVSKIYKHYSLANLLHIALNKADEDMFIVPPKDFWESAYKLALGLLTDKDWSSRFGRALRSAGVGKQDIKNLSMWVKRYGKKLKEGVKDSPPISDLDLILADKFK